MLENVKQTNKSAIHNLLEKGEHTKEGKEILGFLQKFERIEQKEQCLRVQFLDWLSIQLKEWSVNVKEMADNIHSPCALQMPKKIKNPSSTLDLNIKLKNGYRDIKNRLKLGRA